MFSDSADEEDDLSARFLEAALNTTSSGRSGHAAPAVDTVDLLSRLAQSRMNDQRCEMPPPVVKNDDDDDDDEAEARSLPEFMRPLSLEENKYKKAPCKRAFSAGKLPTMPALHWAMTNSGQEMMNSGDPTAGIRRP